jgi:hypothetical protein
MQKAPNATLPITTQTELHRLKLGGLELNEDDVTLGEEAEPVPPGVAMGVAGE